MREGRESRFRATYRVTDVDSPGCVQATITLAVRIQLSQEIARQGVKYSEQLLAQIVKVMVESYVSNGGKLDPECNPDPAADAIAIGYNDFDLLAATAVEVSEAPD